MAFDAFLKIDGIDGESLAQGHEKWIELLSYSWGAGGRAAVGAGAGGGGGAGKANPQAFTFTKLTDSASPEIFVKLCQGSHFQKVTLACRKAGGTQLDAAPDDFIKIDFYNVLFSTFDEGGNTGTDQRPMESVSFAFQKVDFGVLTTPLAGEAAILVSEVWDFGRGRIG